MSTCPSCGGLVGRDCFNPVECAQIAASQQEHAAKQLHYQQGDIAQLFHLVGELFKRVEALEAERKAAQ